MKGSSIPFKKNMIQGGAIVVAAAVLGIFMVCTVKTLKSYDDTVKVRGLCEKEVPADRVVWRISYGEKANDLADLRNTIRKNNDIIVKHLREAGFSDEEIKVGNASYEDRSRPTSSTKISWPTPGPTTSIWASTTSSPR